MANKAKKKLGSSEILSQLEEISGRNIWEFELKGLTRKTRDLLSSLLNQILEKNSITSPVATFYLFSGLIEILLNALKGNMRYVVYKNELMKRISDQETTEGDTEILLDTILATSPLRDAMTRYIIPDKIKKYVQTVLKLEEKIRTKKEALSNEEEILLNNFRKQIKLYDYKISMKVVLTDEDFYIRIRNNVPISTFDQSRIENSRKLHKSLHAEGRSADFFRPENVDDTESAGFGIAMVDEGYYNMGLDPMELFNITSSSKSTTVYMKYPLEALRSYVA